MSDNARPQPVVSGSAVMAAGSASTLAAIVTSKFGVAGTLLGAALTAMIITGGSALLRAYFESAAGKVREVPGRFRSRVNIRKPGGFSGQPVSRNNFFVRLRNALSWFSYLPQYRRRFILKRGAVAAVIAFVIGMGIVTFAESAIGNSLSCGLWGTCPAGAVAGVHIGGASAGTGAEPSVLLARPESSSSSTAAQTLPQTRQEGLFQKIIPGSSDQQSAPQPEQQPAQPATPGQQQAQPAPQPTQQPAPPSGQPAPGGGQQQPVQPAPQPAQPAQPAPEQQTPATPSPSGSEAAPAPPGGAGQQQPSSP